MSNQNDRQATGLISKFERSKIHTKLFTLSAFVLVSFLAFAGLAWNTIGIVQIRGPYYNNIVQSKDLIADILPPPEYLIEAYLVVLQMTYETDSKALEAMVEKSKTLRADFQTRRDFWYKDLPEGEIKGILLKDSYEPGKDFLDIRDREFIPMILQGNRDGARKMAYGLLKEKYDLHRAAVDRVVALSNAKYQNDEAAATAILRSRSLLMLGFGIAIVLLTSLLCWYIIRRIVSSLTLISQGLGSASSQLTSVSQQMSANAEETSSQAVVVSSSSQRVNESVQTVAIGTEEMTSAIREISRSTTESVRVAGTAVTMAEATNASVSKLDASSKEIENIIELITSIAEQTNLLALNAAIEAARAGEAGKGFAVVANEVKELARETGKATEDIKKKIHTIQGDTKGAIASIAEISSIIRQISEIQTTIAGAVEEQSVTTNEIAKNISEAARGTTEISSNITGVAQAAKSTASGANDTRKASDELVKILADLQDFVG